MTVDLFCTYPEIQFGKKKIMQIRLENSKKYISYELKDLFLTSGKIHQLILRYTPESNGIVEYFD
jgi:hypothetical protein